MIRVKQAKKGNRVKDPYRRRCYHLTDAQCRRGLADVTMASTLVREDGKRLYGNAAADTGMWKHLDEEKDAPDPKPSTA